MRTPAVRLIPMLCPKCQAPVPAEPGEIAWVCAACGQGMILDDEAGLRPLEFHYSAALTAGKPGQPYWSAYGTATITERKALIANSEAEYQSNIMWRKPRRLFVPAFTLPPSEQIDVSIDLLLKHQDLEAGDPVDFRPVTVRPDQMRPLLEIVIMRIETARADKLSSILFNLQLTEPELWIL